MLGVGSALEEFLLLVSSAGGGAYFDVADRQIQQFVGGFIVGELPAGLGHFAQLVVDAFDGVGRIDDLAYLWWHVQERHEFVPCPAPGVDDGGAGFAGVAGGERLEGLLGGFDGRGGIDRFQSRGDGLAVFPGCVTHRVTDEMHHAGLDHGLGPYRGDGFGQTRQAIAGDDQDVVHAPVA